MAIAATGFFDGVHSGHRTVIEALVRMSHQLSEKSLVVTFWPHPRSILKQDADKLRLLTSLQEKKSLLESLGVDEVIVLPFSKEFSGLTAAEFLGILKREYDVSHIVIGYDHRIGCDGSAIDLEKVCESAGIVPCRIKEFTGDDIRISSTSIRELISGGDVSRATALLGYEYTVSGAVVSGNKLGRTIGFPTANLQLYEPLKLVPGNGVYEVNVLFDGTPYKGICNIGTRPTVSDKGVRVIEIHILDFDEEIYGLTLTASFVRKIRDEQKFASLDELKKQIEADKSVVSGLK